ncbi:MAG: TonB-dependent receptor [Cytophagales bacterium]|nr:TonB-dependent receptor [Cytophagales bacterium]MDW8385067.1 TonB-dependent receptor [Flammeovirgaceae bacterium]
MRIVIYQIFIAFILLCYSAYSQSIIFGKVRDTENQKPLSHVRILLDGTSFHAQTDDKGEYVIRYVPEGTYRIIFYKNGWQTHHTQIKVNQEEYQEINVSLMPFTKQLEEVQIHPSSDEGLSSHFLNPVENMSIYEGKKTELVEIKDVIANLSTNNARQVFGKIPGLNIWESDGAGLQLGIGARGLSPNRMGNFNVRQNGYDIAADAIGYPESYYTPPLEAVERIEVVRGAGALQYGSQFGGMLNFVMKKGEKGIPIRFTSRQTFGGFNFLNSFNSIGGTIGKTNYYTFVQHKQGKGWRANSQFKNWAFYGKISREHRNMHLYAEYTHHHYTAQQPGGLTYRQFIENPRQSHRPRNWFYVNWNLFSVGGDYRISNRISLNTRFFGVIGWRHSLGNLSKITEADFAIRTLITGNYWNWGNETRLMKTYYINSSQPSVLLIGYRTYATKTIEKHGEAQSNSSEPIFSFKENMPLYSDYQYPGKNYAFFIENVFYLSPKWTITPGIRWENIQTRTIGNYFQTIRDGAGNPYFFVTDSFSNTYFRKFFLFGVGASYKLNEDRDFYANITQNYRPITFSGIAIRNMNRIIDPQLKDEKGFNADLGFRGKHQNIFQWDISIFLLSYQNRIGFVETQENFISKRKTTNVAQSITYGFESFWECNLSRLLNSFHSTQFTFFGNAAFINARYTRTQNSAIRNRYVEFVPPYNMRYGIALRQTRWRTSLQYSITEQHYTDATNAIETPDAVNGIIPRYQIWDWTLQYQFRKWLQIEATVNNLLNTYYFTRRADGYPGPGIIPSDGRMWFITLQCKW